MRTSSTSVELPIRLPARSRQLSWSRCRDPSGQAIADADVTLSRGGKREAWGRTDPKGQLTLDVGEKPGSLLVSAIGHGSKDVSLSPPVPGSLTIEMPEAAGCVGPDHGRAGRRDSVQGAVHRQGGHGQP